MTNPLPARVAEVAALMEDIKSFDKSFDLSTSEIIDKDRQYECPMCSGQGDVDGEDYYNFDRLALGVQFFGVGGDFEKYRRMFATIPRIAALVLELERERKRLEDEAERLRSIIHTYGGGLSIYVQGHFAMPTVDSKAVCLKWARHMDEAIATLPEPPNEG